MDLVPFERAGIAVQDVEPDPLARGIGDRVRGRMLARLLRARGGKAPLILAIGAASVALAERARASLAVMDDAGAALAASLRVVEGTVTPPFLPPGSVGFVDLVLVDAVSEVVPRRILSVEAGEWLELYARDAPRAYEWRPVRLAAAVDGVHARTLQGRVEGPERVVISYPTALFELLRRVEPILSPTGAVLVSDRQGPPAEDVISARESVPGLDFGLLEAFASEVGGSVVRTRDPSRSVGVAAVLQPGMEDDFGPAFEAAYGRPEDDDAEDFALAAGRATGLAAVRHWARCAEIAPEDAAARYGLVRACVDAGLAGVALQSIEGVTGAIGDFDFDFQRGRAHAALGQLAAAIGAYEASLARDRHPVTLANLGALHLLRGDLARSEQHYREALDLAPTLGVALDGLALLESRGSSA